MKNAQHQSLTCEHYTPPHIINFVRVVMGGIDLDPCSNEVVNNWHINAKHFFTEKDDGLSQMNIFCARQDEPLKVWCNPPGGKKNNQSNAKIWLEKIASLYNFGDIEQCFFLLFNREFIGHRFLRGIPRFNFSNRVKYWSWNDHEDQLMEGQWRYLDSRGEMISIMRDEDGDWQAYNADKELVYSEKTKERLTLWLKMRRYGFREWTSAPTQQSTLIYFPPKEGNWKEKVLEATPLLEVPGDYWVFPE